eukprot:scaffold7805_cov116-Isochrysis_galbana.AAC.9
MVEARVRRREALLIRPVARDDKVEVPQALDRDPVRAGREEEELLLELHRQLPSSYCAARSSACEGPPRVDDGKQVWPRTHVHGALLGQGQPRPTRARRPHLEVEVGRPTDEQLELLPPKEPQALAPTHGVEASQEGFELPCDRPGQQILGVAPHVLAAVMLRHRHLAPSRNQIVRQLLPKLLKRHLHAQPKGLLHLRRRLKVEQQLQAVADVGEGLLEVGQRQHVTHQLLVHHMREADIQDDAVVDRHAEQHSCDGQAGTT